MKRTVTVLIDVDPLEYEGAEDTPTGAVALEYEMSSGMPFAAYAR